MVYLNPHGGFLLGSLRAVNQWLQWSGARFPYESNLKFEIFLETFMSGEEIYGIKRLTKDDPSRLFKPSSNSHNAAEQTQSDLESTNIPPSEEQKGQRERPISTDSETLESPDTFLRPSDMSSNLELDETFTFGDSSDHPPTLPFDRDKTSHRKPTLETTRELCNFLKDTGPEDFKPAVRSQSVSSSSSFDETVQLLRRGIVKLFIPKEKSKSGTNKSHQDAQPSQLSSTGNDFSAFLYAQIYGPHRVCGRRRFSGRHGSSEDISKESSKGSYESYLYTTAEDGKLRMKIPCFCPKSILKASDGQRPRSKSMGSIPSFQIMEEFSDSFSTSSDRKVGSSSLDASMMHRHSLQPLMETENDLTITVKQPKKSKFAALLQRKPPEDSSKFTKKQVKILAPSSKDYHYFLDSDAGKLARKAYSLMPAFDEGFILPHSDHIDADLKKQFLEETFVNSDGYQVSTVYKPGAMFANEYYKGKPLYYILGSLDMYFVDDDLELSSDFDFDYSTDEEFNQ